MPTLDSILANADILTLFQPILDGHHQTILGHEALSRGPMHSPYHSAAALFNLAKTCQRTVELEHVCLERAIGQFMALQLEGRLFVNLSATAVLALDIEQLIGQLRRHGLACERLVIELTEQYQNDMESLRDMVTALRESGIALALDDLGAAFSGLRRWLDLSPDFIKLDRYFIQSLHEDPVRRLFVGTLLELANQLNTVFIVEGVETPQEW
ncbi:MAG: EAL domain-containing protein, partial [Aeromonadaceae bacterium]